MPSRIQIKPNNAAVVILRLLTINHGLVVSTAGCNRELGYGWMGMKLAVAVRDAVHRARLLLPYGEIKGIRGCGYIFIGRTGVIDHV